MNTKTKKTAPQANLGTVTNHRHEEAVALFCHWTKTRLEYPERWTEATERANALRATLDTDEANQEAFHIICEHVHGLLGDLGSRYARPIHEIVWSAYRHEHGIAAPEQIRRHSTAELIDMNVPF